MVTGFEAGFYADISRICNYLQSIATDLSAIRKMLEVKSK